MTHSLNALRRRVAGQSHKMLGYGACAFAFALIGCGGGGGHSGAGNPGGTGGDDAGLQTYVENAQILFHQYGNYMDMQGVMKLTSWQNGTVNFTANWAALYRITDPINGRQSPNGRYIALMARQRLTEANAVAAGIPDQKALHWDILLVDKNNLNAPPVNLTAYLQDALNLPNEGLEKEDPYWVDDNTLAVKLSYRQGLRADDTDDTDNYNDVYVKGRGQIIFIGRDGTIKAQFKAADDAELSKPIMRTAGGQTYLVVATGAKADGDIAYAPINSAAIINATGTRSLRTPQTLSFTPVNGLSVAGVDEYYNEPDATNPARFFATSWVSAADHHDILKLYDLATGKVVTLPSNDNATNNSDAASFGGNYFLQSVSGANRYDMVLTRLDGQAITYGTTTAPAINLNEIYRNINSGDDDLGANVWLPPLARHNVAVGQNNRAKPGSVYSP